MARNAILKVPLALKGTFYARGMVGLDLENSGVCLCR